MRQKRAISSVLLKRGMEEAKYISFFGFLYTYDYDFFFCGVKDHINISTHDRRNRERGP